MTEQQTIESLLAEKIAVDTRVGDISQQLSAARAKAASTGIYSDRDWYRRASTAVRRLKRRSQEIQLELHNLRLARRTENTVLSTRLPPERLRYGVALTRLSLRGDSDSAAGERQQVEKYLSQTRSSGTQLVLEDATAYDELVALNSVMESGLARLAEFLRLPIPETSPSRVIEVAIAALRDQRSRLSLSDRRVQQLRQLS